jgi:hypothetical protein
VTSAVATVFLTITNVNDPPVASNVYFTVVQNTNTSLSFPTNDLDGDPVAYALLTMPTNGLISAFNPTNGTFTYTPVHAFIGTDTLDYTVNDGFFTRTGQVTMTVQALPDADGDGIPDLWELAHGLSTATNEAALDADGDGKSNLREYFANTVPQDSRSFIQITSAQTLPNGHFLVTWDAVGGVRYRVRVSNGDIGGGYTGSFTSVPRSILAEVAPGPLGAPTAMTFTDDLSLTGPTIVPGTRYFTVEAIR